jgi:hypothetical protein
MTEKEIKRKDALALFIESVHKPDQELRQVAHWKECYNELMEWRHDVLEYLGHRWRDEFGS